MALEKLEEVDPDPDLILLDLMMPEMDGFTFLRKKDLDGEHREVPVVVVTAKRTDRQRPPPERAR